MVIAVAVSGRLDDTPADAVEDPPAAVAPEPSPSADVEEDEADEPGVEKPERARVPRVVDIRLSRAHTLFTKAGLTVRVTERPSWPAAGVVLGQSVRAGAKVAPGKTVRVVVAAPMPRVPGVVGRTATAAANALRAAGFNVVTTTEAVTIGSGRPGPASGTGRNRPGRAGRRGHPGDQQQGAADRAAGAHQLHAWILALLPPAPDYDCAGGSGDGPKYAGPVRVTGTDPYDLDADGEASPAVVTKSPGRAKCPEEHPLHACFHRYAGRAWRQLGGMG